ncbi:hypothetical protein [Thermoleptolyngbya sichuanensis]|nr:hypothetical protein [Thermoleptolyngbya sichuanensis]
MWNQVTGDGDRHILDSIALRHPDVFVDWINQATSLWQNAQA